MSSFFRKQYLYTPDSRLNELYKWNDSDLLKQLSNYIFSFFLLIVYWIQRKHMQHNENEKIEMKGININWKKYIIYWELRKDELKIWAMGPNKNTILTWPPDFIFGTSTGALSFKAVTKQLVSVAVWIFMTFKSCSHHKHSWSLFFHNNNLPRQTLHWLGNS